MLAAGVTVRDVARPRLAADQAERLAVQAAGIGAGELTRAAEVIAEGLVAMLTGIRASPLLGCVLRQP